MDNEKKLSIEMKVGIFIAMAVFAILVFIFTQTKAGRLRGYEIGVLFDYVSGLEVGSPVRVSGVRVGEVKKIEMLYEAVPKVLVKLKINPSVKIGKHSRITIRTLGIIGEKYVEIIPTSEKEYIEKGEIVDGETPLSIDKIANIGEQIAENLNQILSDIRKITEDKNIQENIKNILNESTKTIAQINNSFNKIDKLLEEISETNKYVKNVIQDNSPRIKSLLENADSFLVSGKYQMEKTMESIRDFLAIKDKTEKMIDNISETSQEFKKTSIEIKDLFEKVKQEGLIARIMKEEKMIDDIKKEISLLQEATLKIKESSEKLNVTLDNLNKIFTALQTGKGSAGKFLYSDELYNEVLDFVKDIKAHPWKLFIKTR